MNYFSISLSDISFDKGQELVDWVAELLMESWEEVAEVERGGKWHDPKPLDWKECYCRLMAIDYALWSDYESGKGDRPDFDAMIRNYAEEQAENRLARAFRQVEIGVEI